MKGTFKSPINMAKLPRWKVLEGERIDQIGYQIGVRLNDGKVEAVLFFPVDKTSGSVATFEDTQIVKMPKIERRD